MTGQVDIERLLDGWLADGPAVMPDGFLASVAVPSIGQGPLRGANLGIDEIGQRGV